MFQDHEQARSIIEEPGKEKTILVVDDDADIGEILVLAFQQETSYRGLWVSDGFQALNIISEIRPDLLLLDYQLPYMNGIDLYDHLHALPGFEHTPGIMMSAQLPKQDIKKRALVGISKPFELSEVLDTVVQLLA